MDTTEIGQNWVKTGTKGKDLKAWAKSLSTKQRDEVSLTPSKGGP